MRPGIYKKKEYTVRDLTRFELDLLTKASYIPADHFMCFGKYYHKLKSLNLVDNEYQLTPEGRSMARAWAQYRAEEKANEKPQDQD